MPRHERTAATPPAATVPPAEGSAVTSAYPPPVAPASVVTSPAVVAPAVVAPAAVTPAAVASVQDVAAGQTVTRRRFVPASGPGALLGIALLVVGGVALARAGTDSPFSTPVVEVIGWSHNAPLAVGELAAGLLLLIVSLSGVRGAMLFVSAILAAAAVVLAVEPDAIDSLVVERSMAVVVAIAAGVVFLVAALVPTVVRTTTHTEAERAIT